MDTWGRYLIIAAFGLHGAGMLFAGLTLPLATRNTSAGFGHSWLLSKGGGSLEAVAGTIIWGLAGLGFIIAAVGLLFSQSWWAYGAWLGAPMTIAAIALWFGAVPMGAYVGGVMAALTLGSLVYTALR